MKYFTLVETAPGSGRFVMSENTLNAQSTVLALKAAAKTAQTGLAVAVSPYRAMRGMPSPVEPSEDEQGCVYTMLLELSEEQPGYFADSGLILASRNSDAANIALTLQMFFGARTALTPRVTAEQDVSPEEPSPTDETPVTSPTSSGKTGSGGSAVSGASTSSGSSGASVTSGASGQTTTSGGSVVSGASSVAKGS